MGSGRGKLLISPYSKTIKCAGRRGRWRCAPPPAAARIATTGRINRSFSIAAYSSCRLDKSRALQLIKPELDLADCRAAMMAMATAAVVLDPAGRVAFANPPAGRMFGRTADTASSLEEMFALAGVEGRLMLPADGRMVAGRVRLSDSRVIQIEARRLPQGGWVLTLDDVSAFVRDAELARHDPLTGLANRAAMQTRLAQLVRGGEPGALFWLDLDRFKAINDTLGHPNGDALLRKVAERLASLAGETDIVARLGGDEFAMLKPGIARPEEAEAVAARIVDLIGRTYVLEGHMMNVSGSVGVVLAPTDGADSDMLLKNADLALYRAKAEGRNRFRFFEPAMDARMQERRALELELRRALAFKEFQLVYQPQIDLVSHRVVGFEALLRWDNPRQGLISPGVFIPIAEETGLIVAIGEWVLRTACKEAAGWPPEVSIAVNLSPLQLRNSRLADTVTAVLAATGLDPARLELEITEGALLEDTVEVVRLLNRFRAMGVRVSMDDFGTGYSSLSYLQKFPFDKIKIDQSFTRGVTDNPQSGAIVRAVAAIGASFGMKTTAEGVETQEQLDAIRLHGCNEVQGYHTGRPMGAAAAAALIAGAPLLTSS